jgi:hypothetical protein
LDFAALSSLHLDCDEILGSNLANPCSRVVTETDRSDRFLGDSLPRGPLAPSGFPDFLDYPGKPVMDSSLLVTHTLVPSEDTAEG